MTTSTRAKILRSLGFATYKAYLRSPLWNAIRRSSSQRRAQRASCAAVEPSRFIIDGTTGKRSSGRS